MIAGQDMKRGAVVCVCLIPDRDGKRRVWPAPSAAKPFPFNSISFALTQDHKKGQDIVDFYVGPDVRGKILATADIELPRLTEAGVVDAMRRIREGDRFSVASFGTEVR